MEEDWETEIEDVERREWCEVGAVGGAAETERSVSGRRDGNVDDRGDGSNGADTTVGE